MTTYELWQQEKYGNYIPESDTDDSDAEDTEMLCKAERVAVETYELGINYPNV